MKKLIIISSIVVISSLIVFALKLGLIIPNPVTLQELGPYHLVSMPVKDAKTNDIVSEEIVILNTTRKLYEAGILKDGHKAKAITIYYPHKNNAAGLLLTKELYETIGKKTPELLLQIIPKKIMLTVSIPRFNVLSLYVGLWKSIPALNHKAQEKDIQEKFRLEIYDKRISYILVPK